MVRTGAAVFGLGGVLFHALELITVAEVPKGDECYAPIRTAYIVALIVLHLLQGG
jgi:hypothetical protein